MKRKLFSREKGTPVVRSGLAPCSFMHFRCDAGARAGERLVDSVAGAYADLVGSDFSSVPNAINNPSSVGLVNYSSIPSFYSNEITDGTIVIYTVFKFGVSAGSLWAPFDTGELHFFIEEQDSISGGREWFSSLAPSTADLLNNIGYTLDRRSDILSSRGIVCCVVWFTLGVPGARGVISDGTKFNYRPLNGDPSFSIDAVKFSSPAIGRRDSSGYLLGVLHIPSALGIPSEEEIMECAKWHAQKAPAGNKDVWPGWNKYSPKGGALYSLPVAPIWNNNGVPNMSIVEGQGIGVNLLDYIAYKGYQNKIRFFLSSGSLPAGIILNDDGTFSGTAATGASGTYTPVFAADNGEGVSSISGSITVAA